MKAEYIPIRKIARKIVAEAPQPDFYIDHADADALSRNAYSLHPTVQKIKTHISETMDENFGHGLHHAEKVALDAGTLVVIVCRSLHRTEKEISRMMFLAHSAGLLHDVMRKKKDHAVEGADYAADFLKPYPFTPDEITDICDAIRNHEAFKTVSYKLTEDGTIISDCLYDADKFRWGPDNFTHTVWDMVSNAGIPLKVFMSHFQKGLETVGKVRETFRSAPGRKYGPQFIDIGMEIGLELYRVITSYEHKKDI